MSNHCGNTVNIPCYRVKWFTASNKWRRISDFPNYFNSWNYLSSIGSGITLICWFYFTLSIIGITSILPDPSISGNRWLQGFHAFQALGRFLLVVWRLLQMERSSCYAFKLAAHAFNRCSGNHESRVST